MSVNGSHEGLVEGLELEGWAAVLAARVASVHASFSAAAAAAEAEAGQLSRAAEAKAAESAQLGVPSISDFISEA